MEGTTRDQEIVGITQQEMANC